ICRSIAAESAVAILVLENARDRRIARHVDNCPAPVDISRGREMPISVDEENAPSGFKLRIDEALTDRVKAIGAHKDGDQRSVLVSYGNSNGHNRVVRRNSAWVDLRDIGFPFLREPFVPVAIGKALTDQIWRRRINRSHAAIDVVDTDKRKVGTQRF